MSVDERDDLARELSEYGYSETDDPQVADARNYYKVEKWDVDDLHVLALLYASNDLSRARDVFAAPTARPLHAPPGHPRARTLATALNGSGAPRCRFAQPIFLAAAGCIER
jgi:hypothetical protein